MPEEFSQKDHKDHNQRSDERSQKGSDEIQNDHEIHKVHNDHEDCEDREIHKIQKDQKVQNDHCEPREYRLILENIDVPNYSIDIECYEKHGGYETLQKALLKGRSVAEKDAEKDGLSSQEWIREEVKKSGLRGRGGAGFSCGLKWSFVDRKSGKPIYLICNADESEPGTFKDRQIIYKDPHQLIEGMILSAYANDVHLAYIYIRGEFVKGAQILNHAIDEARREGYLGKDILGSGYDLEIHIHRGAGAYICGEETGLIESLEGKRPYPRIKPPFFPAVLGLYLCPTIVNNVETLCAIKHIVSKGGDAFSRLGTPGNTGTRIVSLSGQVNRPGYYEIELGKVSLGELIFHKNFGNGLRKGRKLKAIIPGGASAKVFRADETFMIRNKNIRSQTSQSSESSKTSQSSKVSQTSESSKTSQSSKVSKVSQTSQSSKGSEGSEVSQTSKVGLLDLPYDFDSMIEAGSMSGSGAIIVLDDSADIVEALSNIAAFYAHESCGQCTPCREGSLWMSKALSRLTTGKGRRQDADDLIHIAQNIQGRTICAFGEACAWPVLSFVEKFRDEFQARGKADDSEK